ncbi:MAG TPA: ATP-binding protein, partial [Fimbriimonadaceae bacterium]|nr:ATP-binding protein [Fimbriimonadaceae bacterium]
PRKTAIFAPTFDGTAVTRSDDITKDPRYGKNEPYFGMPEGHLPVSSYLAVPVVSRSGEVLGGLFFGHSEPGVFTARHEKLLVGIAAHAAVAFDNAHLLASVKRELAARERAEHQIRQLNAQLERRVQERTAQLEAANKELEGFCYSVSHDMRTPLRGIVASARFLEEDFADRIGAKGVEDLRELARSAQRVAQLVNDLLEFSRISRKQVAAVPVDLSSLAERAADEVKQATGCKNASIRIGPGLQTLGDPDLLHMVLVNLMENSCKYAKRGEDPEMEFGRTPEGVYFLKDKGLGFSMEFAHKLFMPFERLHGDTNIPGTGIGLANVKRVIELHGGDVWAESEPGAGATFFFKLPDSPAESVSGEPEARVS